MMPDENTTKPALCGGKLGGDGDACSGFMRENSADGTPVAGSCRCKNNHNVRGRCSLCGMAVFFDAKPGVLLLLSELEYEDDSRARPHGLCPNCKKRLALEPLPTLTVNDIVEAEV